MRATDPSGESDDIVVTITAGNVNEPPSVLGYVALTVREGITDTNDMFVYNALPLDLKENSSRRISTRSTSQTSVTP